MNERELQAAITKLQYQIRILAGAIDYERNPIEALILEMDWEDGDINKVHDIFEKWDKHIDGGGELPKTTFEQDFHAFGIDYQTLKSIVIAFYRNGQWTNVCEAYVDAFKGSPPLEYHSIMRRERI